VVKYVLLRLVIAGVFLVVFLVARARRLIGPNSSTWRKTLVYAVWSAALFMAILWLDQGFDAWPLGIGDAAFIGALFGAIFGLVLSIKDFRMRRRAG
jgi:membrane associated rhomboid family serine protease